MSVMHADTPLVRGAVGEWSCPTGHWRMKAVPFYASFLRQDLAVADIDYMAASAPRPALARLIKRLFYSALGNTTVYQECSQVIGAWVTESSLMGAKPEQASVIAADVLSGIGRQRVEAHTHDHLVTHEQIVNAFWDLVKAAGLSIRAYVFPESDGLGIWVVYKDAGPEIEELITGIHGSLLREFPSVHLGFLMFDEEEFECVSPPTDAVLVQPPARGER